MATEKKVLVLNPLTGELQQLQSDQTVFGLKNGDLAATQPFVTDAVATEATARDAAILVETNRAKAAEGDLTALTTTDKTSLVGAVNELVAADNALDVRLDALEAQPAADDLQAELDATQTGAGLSATGAYVVPTTSNYLNSTVSLADADAKLDTQIKVVADGLASEITRATGIESGLRTDVTAIQDQLTGRLSDATLDTRYVNVAGDTMEGMLTLFAVPSTAMHAATKGYVDSLAGGLSWQEPVGTDAVAGIGSTKPTLAGGDAGVRFIDTTDGKIYTWSGSAWDAGVAAVDGFAVFDKSSETGYVYTGSAWVQFTGTGQITAGLGLSKNGNVLNVDLATGGALYFSPSVDGESPSAIALNTSAEFAQTGGVLALVDGGIANAKLVNSSISINGSSVALGGSFTIAGAGAISVVDTSGVATINVADATTTTKGVASFNSGSFAVDTGAVELADVGIAGTYGSATHIPVITTDAKGRVTDVTTETIDTGASATSVITTGTTVGDAVYVSASGTVAKAQANASSTTKVAGIVSADGRIVTAGVVNGLSGLTPGVRYFLSNSVAGALVSETAVEAYITAGTGYIAPVGIAVTSSSLALQIGMPVQL